MLPYQELVIEIIPLESGDVLTASAVIPGYGGYGGYRALRY